MYFVHKNNTQLTLHIIFNIILMQNIIIAGIVITIYYLITQVFFDNKNICQH